MASPPARLIRAGYLLGETRYLESRRAHPACCLAAMNRYPQGHMSLLEALEEYLAPPEIVIVREQVQERGACSANSTRHYAPHRLVFSIPADLAGLDPAVADKKPGPSTRAYVCRGSTCSAPVEALADLLRSARARLTD